MQLLLGISLPNTYVDIEISNIYWVVFENQMTDRLNESYKIHKCKFEMCLTSCFDKIRKSNDFSTSTKNIYATFVHHYVNCTLL